MQESATSAVNPDEVEALLAAELNAMTFDQRETIYEEIHGVEKKVEENDRFLEDKLATMDEALKHVPNRALYEQALSIDPAYVQDRAFRLMFLRCEYYDPEKAAWRLVRFLEGKVRFFGADALARPICLSDFDEDDMAFLKSGIIQIIPARDRSGRVVISDFNMNPNSELPKHVDNMVKTVVYVMSSAAEDEETQKRGMVGIFYFTSALRFARDLHDRNAHLFDWLPLKLVGGHFCFQDPRLRIVRAILMLAIGKDRRVRVRMHEGSHTECQYQLMTFGVNVNVFPVAYEGELKTTNHLKWLARRKAKEEFLRSFPARSFKGVDLPSLRDVLLGRGKTVQDHAGNVVMRNLIATYLPEYKSAAKLLKGQVAWKVVVDVKKRGGRFLKRDSSNGWWMEVTDDVAQEKISMTFRTIGPTKLAAVEELPSGVRKSEQTNGERHRKRAREIPAENDEKPVLLGADPSGSSTCFDCSKALSPSWQGA